ncbi:MAG: aminoacyl-tRNA deacylase [Planctomycetaceae bacterium]|nr:aminoacyl-tRNA deacylase [Planctomycetaceae bacterium]MBQ2820852.1 aminoacyl-tRNA deacylase [Thermoguttaceae bacterium]
MKAPMTNAVRALQKAGVAYELMAYKYEEHGGTRVGARELGVDEHQVIKTIVFQTEDKPVTPFIVLMHGDCEISAKEMARVLNVKGVKPCDPKDADRFSGYHVGGTSPFGTKRSMTVYVQESILELPEIFINAGSKGLLFKMDPKDIEKVVDTRKVNVLQ